MSASGSAHVVDVVLKWSPAIVLAAVIVGFSVAAPAFFTLDNLAAVLTQSSWLIVVALGVNLVLLTGGVDLSVGSAMYLAAVVIGLALGDAPAWVCLPAAILVGGSFGACNGLLVVRFGLPSFIVTLAMIFIGRGIGLYLSSTKILFASPAVAELGRAHLLGVPLPLITAAMVVLLTWVLLEATQFGTYVRSLGFDSEGARRAGVRTSTVSWWVFALCGAYAGLGGLISLSQTAAASASFGQNNEFLAIAAAVLGGTSLFGGRGTWWAPVIGSILIMTVQNGLVMINANPYAYPVITGLVIFVAVLIDSLRARAAAGAGRRRILAEQSA